MRIRAVLPAPVLLLAMVALPTVSPIAGPSAVAAPTASPSIASPPIANSSARPAAKALFRLSDPRLSEVSGLAPGHRSPSVLYVQNDGGDRARFYALDAGTGAIRAVCTVPGAQNVDWEDIATAPDRSGRWSVWLADIGDNDAVRSEIRIYRVAEPVIGSPSQLDTERPDVWRLRYPDGPHDAESLVVDPVDGRLYVITKALLGHSAVFQAPEQPDPTRVRPMSRVGSIDFGLTGTPGGPNPVGQLTATGAAMAADGSLLAVRTYTDAYLWRVGNGRIAAALRQRPVRVPLPAQPQGEGIAVTDGALLLDSEGTGSQVYRVPLPALPRATPSPSGTSPSGTSPSGTSPSGTPAGGPSTDPASTSPANGSSTAESATDGPHPGTGHRTSTNRDWLVSTATIGALAAVALLARRRRRRDR